VSDADLALPASSAADLVPIEDAGLNASAPREQRMLDGWLLRFSPGKAKRARCVNALYSGRLALAHKLERCERAYAEAGLPMIVRVTPLSEPAGLDATLAAMGFRRFDDTRVMLLPEIDALAARSPIDLVDLDGDEFAHTVGALRASPAAQVEAHASRLRQTAVRHRAFALREDGRTLACGQFAVEGRLVGLYDVFTAEEARNRGLGTRLCRELLARAHADGARSAYLQVEADNHAARAIYHRLGFADAYAYHYRTRDPRAS